MARRREVDPDQIVEAAVRCFAERGYESTRTAAIAREAGVSEGTLYNYFRDKHALFLAVVERINDKIEQEFRFDAVGKDDVVEFFLDEARRIAAFAHEHPESIQILVRDLRHREATPIAVRFMERNQKRIQGGIDRLVEAMGFQPEPEELEAIRISFHSGIENFINRWCVDPTHIDLQAALAAYIRGFLTLLEQRGRKAKS